MKIKPIYLSTLILLYACDTRKDTYGDINKKPEIKFKVSNNKNKGYDIPLYSDYITTLNDTFKAANDTFTISLIVNDDENEVFLTGASSDGFKTQYKKTHTGIFSSPSFGIIDNKLSRGLIYDYIIKFIDGNNPRKTSLLFLLKDSYGITDTASLNFTLINNLQPVERLDVVFTGINSPYEYKIDASASYDTDTRFGGGITEYEYAIGSYYLKLPNPSINYIFQGPGTYQVKVRVKDNDNEWSNYITKTVVIQ